MRKSKILNIVQFFSFFFIFSISSTYAQLSGKSKIDKLIINAEFDVAIEELNKILEKNPDNPVHVMKLGYCYLVKNDPDENPGTYFSKAKSLFESENNKQGAANSKFFLAKSYRINSKFDEAIKLFSEILDSGDYKELNFAGKIDKDYSKYEKDNAQKAEKIIERELEYCKNGISLFEKKRDIVVQNLGENINSRFSDHSPCFGSEEQKMFFTSTRKIVRGKVKKRKYEDENIFQSFLQGKNFSPAEKLKGNVNSPIHDASCCISHNDEYLFIYCDENIYKTSESDNGQWARPLPVSLSINSDYREADICKGSKENEYFISSDIPGGYGGLDIYRITFDDEGNWSEPENLGSKINTEFDDDSPYYHSDGTIFFSSKGHNSMGGYDIFSSKMNKNGGFETPVNLGKPINSVSDDTHYYLKIDKTKAYFTSLRVEGLGSADIYFVNYADSARYYLFVKGSFKEKDKIPKNMSINVYDINSKNLLEKSNVDDDGNYAITLKKGNKYFVSFEAPGHYFDATFLSIPNDTVERRFLQNYKVEKVKHGEVNQKYMFSFEDDSDEITNTTQFFLDVLSNFLKNNPNVVFDLSTNESNNKELNKKRVEKVTQYLNERGIHETRMSLNLIDFNIPKSNVLITVLDNFKKEYKNLKKGRVTEMNPNKYRELKTREKANFTIQLAAYMHKVANYNERFRQYSYNIKEYNGNDGWIRYTHGEFITENEAEQMLIQIKDQGFPDAFVRDINWYNSNSN